MKKNIAKTGILLLTALFFYSVNYVKAQELTKFNNDNDKYFKLIENTNSEIAKILVNLKPSEMSLDEYRNNLILGKIGLSEEQQNKILEIATPLANYGYDLAKMNGIQVDDADISSKLSYATLNLRTFGFKIPGVTINENLTWGEVGSCALGALGVDIVWSITASTGTAWTMAAIRTAFTNAAKRFLGPIGVALAVGSFTWCLIQESQDYQTTLPPNDPKGDFKNIRLQIDPDFRFVF